MLDSLSKSSSDAWESLDYRKRWIGEFERAFPGTLTKAKDSHLCGMSEIIIHENFKAITIWARKTVNGYMRTIDLHLYLDECQDSAVAAAVVAFNHIMDFDTEGGNRFL